MEREAVLVGIDVGTSKVTVLIGEVRRDGALTIIGKGTVRLDRAQEGRQVVNIDQTVHSIARPSSRPSGCRARRSSGPSCRSAASTSRARTRRAPSR